MSEKPAAPHATATIAPAAMEVIDRLRVLACQTCGIAFAAPEALFLQRVDSAQAIVCPNGHALVYREPDPAERRRPPDATSGTRPRSRRN